MIGGGFFISLMPLRRNNLILGIHRPATDSRDVRASSSESALSTDHIARKTKLDKGESKQ